MALVSVIVPFRDVVEYLGATLESLAGQTYKDFEVVLIDDGSKCHYPDYAKEWEGILDIRLFRTEPRGVSSARNTGLRASHSQYVAFLDADDVWLPRKLERQIEMLSNNPDYDGIYCNAFLINEADEFIGKTRSSQGGMALLPEGTVQLGWSDKIITSTVLLKRRGIDEIKGFDESLRIAEDWDFFLRKPFRFLCIQEPLILYRRHGLSVGKVNSQGYHDAIRVVESHCARFPHGKKREKAIVISRIYFNEFGNLFRTRRFLKAIRMFSRAMCSSPMSILHMGRQIICARILSREAKKMYAAKKAKA